MVRKILVVEDEEDILEMLSAILRISTDCTVLLARDGEEALQVVREHSPDVLLLDIRLPKLDGHEVCKSIKSDPTTSHIKIIMMSGLVQNFDRQKAKEAGADAYIAKPFSSSVLVEKVEELLSLNNDEV